MLFMYTALLFFCGILEAASTSGEITLPYSLSDTNQNAATKVCGDVAKVSWKCRAGESAGWDTLFVQATVTNSGVKPMWGQASIAFFDKDNQLVTAAAQAFVARRGLKAKSARTTGTSRLYLTKGRYQDIVSYRVVIQELDRPPQATKGTILLEDP